MTIEIPQDYQDVLNNAVASGAFVNHDEALRHALQLLAVESQAVTVEKQIDHPEEWATRFRNWAESHPRLSDHVEFDRDSLYKGRGL